jgi:DNA-binding NarL/FixJ family response regulator
MARKIVKRALPANFCHTLYEAADGAAAIDILKTHPIDFMTLDLTMPLVNGVAVLEYLKESKSEVFTLVISGDVQPQMQAKVMELGALGFMQKPVKAADLVNVLRQYGLF